MPGANKGAFAHEQERMKIEGEHRFAAPRAVVWEAVLDPEVLTRILPGCEDFQQTGENEFAGTLKIKVGPVQGVFKGEVVLSELVEPSSYHLSLKGKGAPGFVNGEGDLSLADAEDGGTLLSYVIDAKVGGRIASVGQRLLDSSTKVITRQAMEGLERQIEARAGGTEGGGESAAPATISQEELAAEVAKGVLADLLPPEKQVWLIPLLGLLFLIPPLLIANC